MIIAMLNASDALFELVYSGENAFHITVNHFYMIDFTRAPEIQSILGFESSMLVKGLDNPRQYFLSTSCNQIVVLANGETSLVLSMPTDTTRSPSSSRLWATKWTRYFPRIDADQ